MAHQGRKLLEQNEKVAIMPLAIFSQQIEEWPWNLSPEVFTDSCLLEESPIAIEQVHVLILGHGLQEVAVWMSSEYLRIAHLPSAPCLACLSTGCSTASLLDGIQQQESK